MMRRRGFSLMEVLVVIAILAVLMGILLPVVASTRQQATRTRCAANLRTWGQALYAYAAANRGKLPLPFWAGGSPSAFRTGREADDGSQISLVQLAPFLKGYDPARPFEQQTLRGVWVCPADAEAGRPGAFLGGTVCHLHYAYFWAVSQWNPLYAPTHPQRLCDQRLDANRLLMSDLLLYRIAPSATVAEAWFFNHGRWGRGHPIWSDEVGLAIQGGRGSIRRLGGANQLYGDGRVEWKTARQFQVDRLASDPWSEDLPHTTETYY